MDSSTPNDNSSAADIVVSDELRAKYPQLTELILKTESMTDDERKYWVQILPIMTEEQVTRLRKILEEEAQQLAQLDAQYQDELTELNAKHMAEWNTMEKKQQREARQAAEATAEAEEQGAEDALLSELDQV